MVGRGIGNASLKSEQYSYSEGMTRAPLLALLALTFLSGCALLRAPRVATALTAHLLCTQTFVAGQDPQAMFDGYVSRIAGIRLIAGGLSYRVDHQAQEVRATLLGGAESRAVHANGRGCTVLNTSDRPAPLVLIEAPFAPDPLAAPV